MSGLLVAFAIVLVAAVAQAVSGFGFALVAVPLLAVTTDARTAVVAAALPSLALTLVTMLRERRHIRWRTTALVAASALLGAPLGLLLLVVTPDRLLTALIAVMVLGCTVLVWSGVRMHAGPGVVGAVGVLCGVLTTAVGTNGPPLVAALHALGYDPRTFRATLAAIFTGTGSIGLVGFLAVGQVHGDALRIGVLGIPAVALGWWLGNLIFARIGPVVFRRVMLVGLTASAGAAIARSLTG
ncbi:sulfite exporter TauE/SafE family protein [Micromonospora echinofusca]|uniref:Probable membrane transporter protein n=1 Tax=Micromonospora echinofusca TaxID=47858 RepID=A0ABS3VTR5_MICEH|nr:sulfite exporter TauE/SafE family protein [Micromonospora echinofusca]MBO4207920.1 TSUP family transporter [Micromonospora echinofusca]